MSKIKADQVDAQTTGIPKVKSIEGGAVKTVDLKTALGSNAFELQSVDAAWLVAHVQEAYELHLFMRYISNCESCDWWISQRVSWPMYFNTGNILLSQSDELDKVVQSYDWLNQAHTQTETNS